MRAREAGLFWVFQLTYENSTIVAVSVSPPPENVHGVAPAEEVSRLSSILSELCVLEEVASATKWLACDGDFARAPKFKMARNMDLDSPQVAQEDLRWPRAST